MASNHPAKAEPAGLTDEELLRTYGAARRDYCYEGDVDDWPNKEARAATVAGLRAVIARWGRPVPSAAPIRAALERLVIMASNDLGSGQLVYSRPKWDDAIAAARAALVAQPAATPAPPADGEGEGEAPTLAAWLLKLADERTCNRRKGIRPHPSALTRVAVLLQQQGAELERLRSLADEVSALVAESDGVAGLHLNGDIAPWDELLPGGQYERLTSLPSGEVG